ncbi:MAG: DNA repair protein RecN [Clostridia bacterium]|nr:DNA repair protein RecN [Clostridia bacterium]
MLTELTIENVAVIERAKLRFDGGFNVLTGETGAGKSIVIDAINAVLGERTGRDVVRTGKDSAKVSAFFDTVPAGAKAVLASFGFEEEDELLITRTISADGKSVCRLNGRSVTASMLKTLGRELVTICGQHDSQHLLQKERHLDYIDFLANCDDLKEAYLTQYRALKNVKRQLRDLRKNNADKSARLDYLAFQIKELEEADIRVGERDALNAQKKKLQNREKRLQALQTVSAAIDGDGTDGLLDRLYTLSGALAQLSDADDSFAPFSETAQSFRYDLEECASLARQALSDDETQELDLDKIEARLDRLYRLGQKYGQSEEEMLQSLTQAKADYDAIAFSEERIAALEEEDDRLSDEVLRLGCHLSDLRKEAALAFEQKVMAELTFLDMPDAVFQVEFREQNAMENGLDEVEFCISANRGQPPKPLSKIASGGELSRIMLAIRCVLSEAEGGDTMIFDEIDTGVSGRAASRIADRLRRVAAGRQVLCVTHLAQIAAAANCHLLVEKTADETSTYTRVTQLGGSARETELARIIGGDLVTDATLRSARELIAYYA